MAWAALKWLRPERREWWSRLSPTRHHLACVIVNEAIRSEAAVGSPVISYTTDELATVTGSSRFAVARDLAALLEAQFIRMDSRRGRGSRLLIAVQDPDPESGSSAHFGAHIPAHFSAQFFEPENDMIPPTSGLGQKSDAQLGAHFTAHFPAQFPDPGSHDLDQRSQISDSGSDLSERSTTSREKSNKGPTVDEKTDPPKALDGVTLEAAGLVLTSPTPNPKRVKRTGPDVARIPERAWKAADWLRDALIAQDPSCWISRQPWEPGAMKGTRAKWADEFRLLHERDKKTFEEIGEVCKWLFKGQAPGAPQFIVQSPDSLRQKWDAIAAVRRNQAARAAAPPRPGQPDNRPKPEPKRWDHNWTGGDPK